MEFLPERMGGEESARPGWREWIEPGLAIEFRQAVNSKNGFSQLPYFSFTGHGALTPGRNTLSSGDTSVYWTMAVILLVFLEYLTHAFAWVLANTLLSAWMFVTDTGTCLTPSVDSGFTFSIILLRNPFRPIQIAPALHHPPLDFASSTYHLLY